MAVYRAEQIGLARTDVERTDLKRSDSTPLVIFVLAKVIDCAFLIRINASGQNAAFFDDFRKVAQAMKKLSKWGFRCSAETRRRAEPRSKTLENLVGNSHCRCI
jgi:hypothetical protein